MLAPYVFRRSLYVGKIEKPSGIDQPYWIIPVEVRARSLWELFVSDIEARATINYLDKDGSEKSNFATWLETIMEVPKVTLQIGGIDMGIIIAKTDGKQLLPLNGRTHRLFKDDQDITLKLTSRRTSLGQWRFPKAIVGGVMQEVSPIKI